MEFEKRVDVDAPAQRVWQVWSDVARWPEWTASVSRVERLEPGALVVGSRTRVTQPGMPGLVWVVEQLVPGTSFTWTNRSFGLTSVGEHLVEAREGGSTAVARIRQTGPLAGMVGRLLRSRTERWLALEAAGLKQRSEGSLREPSG